MTARRLKQWFGWLLAACWCWWASQAVRGAEEVGHPSGASAHGTASAEGPIDFRADLGLWTLVTFAVLAALLARTAWRPMLHALRTREDHIRGAVEEAERARAEAQRLLEEHRRRLEGAQEEVRALLEQARHEAQQMQEQLLAQARQEAHRMLEQAQHSIAQARDQALQELFDRVADLATQAAERIIRRQLTPEDHRRLVSEALVELVGNGKPPRSS
jgi:F-type H+-transporting ATPase subunit b